jgi:hypothetical protein
MFLPTEKFFFVRFLFDRNVNRKSNKRDGNIKCHHVYLYPAGKGKAKSEIFFYYVYFEGIVPPTTPGRFAE